MPYSTMAKSLTILFITRQFCVVAFAHSRMAPQLLLVHWNFFKIAADRGLVLLRALPAPMRGARRAHRLTPRWRRRCLSRAGVIWRVARRAHCRFASIPFSTYPGPGHTRGAIMPPAPQHATLLRRLSLLKRARRIVPDTNRRGSRRGPHGGSSAAIPERRTGDPFGVRLTLSPPPTASR